MDSIINSKMKYVVILGDGMADYPCHEIGGKTPLEVAKKPAIDFLSANGIIGRVATVPNGFKPGSDVANLSVMGYAPEIYYSGRSPLEALSIGIDMKDDDIAIRCNLVTLSDEPNLSDKSMLDYSAGEISTAEAVELISAVQNELGDDEFTFYGGVSYRHCLIHHKGSLDTNLTPPHDISDKKVTEYLPLGSCGQIFIQMMEKSHTVLKNHPINIKRIADGKKPATHIWLWGAGTKPKLDSFFDKYGLNGAVVSAVDLLLGIGIGAKMKPITVEGATGNLHTNIDGKINAVLNAFENGIDYVYLHIEAPDECGHQGDLMGKIKAIEMVDYATEKIYQKLKQSYGNFTIAVLPDHYTPICKKTHTSDPVPFIVYASTEKTKSDLPFSELNAEKGLQLKNGYDIICLMKDTISKSSGN